nr:DUF4262 domain-containing protein [uncultured Hyphomonas sp.]
MRTALDAPPNTLDEHERSFVELLKKHGWFRTSVLEDEEGPGFSYTTGFWISTGRPELVMFGMMVETVHEVFWSLFRDAQSGLNLAVGKRTDAVFANLPAYAFLIAKQHYPQFLGWNRWFYLGDDVPCLQIVWPDREGVFPWEPGFSDEFRDKQVDLTERGWINEVLD